VRRTKQKKVVASVLQKSSSFFFLWPRAAVAFVSFHKL